MTDSQSKIIEAMHEYRLCDFIKHNYLEIQKEDLVRCLLEILFAINDYENVLREASEILEQYWQE